MNLMPSRLSLISCGLRGAPPPLTVCGFSKLLAELDQMVRRMVLESLGAEKHYDSLMKTNKFLLRLSKYPAGS
ncbi:hypothetical protein DsansV1_C42g0238201 [Dioscorea sansibarensis]